MRPRGAPTAVLVVLLAGPIASACHSSAEPPPTTPPTTPSTTAHNPNPDQKRCIAEATFLIRVADAIIRVVPTQEATPGTGGMRPAIQALESQGSTLVNRTFHPLFEGDVHRLLASVNVMIEGYEGLLGPGHHAHDRELNRQITEAASMAAVTQTDLRRKRGACVP